MKTTLIAILALSSAAIAYSQEMTDVQRAAQIFAATMPTALKDEMRRKLVEKGKSEAEAERDVAQAIDDYTMCVVNSALDQGRSQGISEDALLKSLTGQSVTAVEEMEANRFDGASFRKRIATCRKTMSSELGLEMLSAQGEAQ